MSWPCEVRAGDGDRSGHGNFNEESNVQSFAEACSLPVELSESLILLNAEETHDGNHKDGQTGSERPVFPASFRIGVSHATLPRAV
jgi:hypothetical protein